MTENPVYQLLQSRRSTDFAGSLSLLAGLVLAVMFFGPDWRAGLRFALIFSSIVYLFIRGAADASPLASWRRGRFLELVLLSPLTPGAIVDGLAIYSLRKTARTALGLSSLALVAGVAGVDEPLIWVAVLLPLLMLTAAFALIYLCIAVPGLSALVSLGLLWSATCAGAAWPAPVALAFTLAGLGARQNAARALVPSSEIRVGHLPERQYRSVRLWSDNPMIVRELRREARRAGAGALDLFLHRHGGFTLICLLTVVHILTTTERWFYVCQIDAYLLLVSLAILQTLRTALVVTPAVILERESDTLIPLALCGLSVREFLSGWARWGWRYRMRENLFGIGCALALAAWGVHITPWRSEDCTPYPLPMYTGYLPMFYSLARIALTLLVFTWASSYLGLTSSALSRTQRGAVTTTMTLLALLGTGALLTFGSLGAAHCIALGLAAGVGFRWIARHSLTQGAR